MIHENNFLEQLYYEMIVNTPQTCSMDIPSEMGTGRIAQTTTKQGIILSDWHMCYSSDMNIQGLNSGAYFHIIFCLNEGLTWNMMKGKQTVSIQKGESCIYKGHGETEYSCYMKEKDFLFKSIKIPVPYFEKILQNYFESQEIAAYKEKLFSTVSKVSITPTMERLLAEFKDFVLYRGGLGYIYLDGKVLELLAIYLSEVLELDILANNCIPLSKSDRAALHEAKQIIDSSLSRAPSCGELSKMVQLNMNKLTKGFSNLFGMPVHRYIIDQRLIKAAQLLVETEMTIAQIAMSVGYSKASNFSAAFHKKYGILPKYYRDTQLTD